MRIDAKITTTKKNSKNEVTTVNPELVNITFESETSSLDGLTGFELRGAKIALQAKMRNEIHKATDEADAQKRINALCGRMNSTSDLEASERLPSEKTILTRLISGEISRDEAEALLAKKAAKKAS